MRQKTSPTKSVYEKKFLKNPNYRCHKLLKSGAFGAVYSVRDIHGKELAAKVVLKDEEAPRRFMKVEIQLLKSFEHPGIVRLLDFDKSDSRCFFTMELATGGDLAGRFDSKRADEKCARHIFQQIVEALDYLHTKRAIVHSDIKPNNVLLMTQHTFPVVKLTDFGVSRGIYESARRPSFRGTLRYAAPEMLRIKLYPKVIRKPLNEKVDIFSLGLTFLRVTSAVKVLPGQDKRKEHYVQFYRRWRHEIKRGVLTDEVVPKLREEGKSDELVSFFSRCVAVNEAERASAAELLRHPWLCGPPQTAKCPAKESYLEQRFLQLNEKMESLKRGKFGAVFAGKDANGETVAAKVLIGGKNAWRSGLIAEYKLLSSLRHEGIVKVLGSDPSSLNCFFTMELATGGDLEERFKMTKASERCARHIFKQVLAAVDYLHNEKEIVHNDIKPANVLLMTTDSLPVAKLTDFGESRSIFDTKQIRTTPGTPVFMAPEKLKIKCSRSKLNVPAYDEKVDIYAIGVSLVLVCSYLVLFETTTGLAVLLEEIESGEFLRKTTSKLKKIKTKKFVSFFHQCMNKEPSARASARDLLRHDWLNTVEN